MSETPQVKVETGDSAERRAFRTRQISRIGFVAVLIAAILVTYLTERGRPAATPTPTKQTISIVASTSVWGSVAKLVGGNLVSVKSLISNPNQDPHSYVATPRDRLNVNKADIIISNGGGYDDFMQAISIDASGKTKLSAFAIAGAQSNEHVWYDLEATRKIARAIANAIEKADGTKSPVVEKNYTNFAKRIDALIAKSQNMTQGLDNLDVIETEPIANYLLLSMGFKNSTPTEFTKAIEEERDVPPLVLKKVEDAIKLAQVNFLAMNPTTETAQTNSLANQAKQNGVAVLYCAELPGKNQNYISWMNSNIEQVRKLTGVDQ